MRIWIKRCNKILVCLGGSIALALSGVILYLSLYPLSLQPFFPSGKQTSEGEIWQIEYSSLELFFSFGFWLRATEAKLRIKKTEEISELGKLEIKLDTSELLFGEVLPNKVMARNLNLSAKLSDNGFSVAGFLLSSTKNQTQPKETQSPFDLITVLTTIHDPKHPNWKYLSSLDTLSVTDAKIVFDDQTRGKKWVASDLLTEVSIEENGRLNFTTSLKVQKNNSEMPLSLKLRHSKGSSSADITLKLSLNDLRLLEGYIPENVVNVFSGPTTLRATSILKRGNLLSSPKISLRCGKGHLLLPDVFTHKIPFESLKLKSTVTYGSGNANFQIDSFELLDLEGMRINAKGSIASYSESPSIRLSIKISSTSVDHLAKYLPDAAAPELSEWLDKNLKFAQVRSAKFEMNGPLSELFSEKSVDSRLKASFDYQGLEIHFWDRAPPGQMLSGQFRMDGGKITVQAEEGFLSNQKISNLEVTIDKLFVKDTPSTLSVQGKVNGELPELLKGFQTSFANNSSLSFSTTGRQLSEIRISLPLKPDLSENDVTLNVSSTLQNLRVASKTPPFLFNSEKISNLKVEAHKLSLDSYGLLNGFPLKLTLEEDTRFFGEKTKIDISTSLSHSYLNQYIPNSAAKLEGTSNTSISLRKNAKGQFLLESLSDFLDLSIKATSLNWEKRKGVPGRLHVKGILDPKERSLRLQTINATAPGFLLLDGSGSFDIGGETLSFLDLGTLTIGNSGLAIRYDGTSIRIQGRSLDLRSMTMNDRGNTKTKLPDIDLSFAIEKILLKPTTFHKCTGRISAKDGQWNIVTLKGKTTDEKTTQFKLQIENKEPTVVLHSDDAESIGKFLGLESKLRGGRVEAKFTVPKGEEFSLKQAKGSIKFYDVSVIESPLLLQILSYFSLQQWLSTNKGVLFSDIEVPITKNKEIVTFGDARFEGPWITLYLSGTMNTENNHLDLTGQVVPFSMMGKVMRKVPIIGKSIAYTQRLLTGARFSVSGTGDKPVVSFFGIPVSD